MLIFVYLFDKNIYLYISDFKNHLNNNLIDRFIYLK